MALTARRPAPRPAAGWGPAAVLLVIVLATAALRAGLLDVPLERDEGEYAYMGQLILRGETPYVAAHGQKLPGVYYAYAAILALLGETDAGIRIALVVINAAAIVLVYRLGRALLDAGAGLTAAAAYAALSLSQSVAGFTANAEHFVVPPMLAGVLLLARPGVPPRLGRIAAAGLLLGTAVLMKQHGTVFVLFGAGWLLARARGRPRARSLAAGGVLVLAAVVPFALACGGMALAGAFEPFWFWTVTYARSYATMIAPGTAGGFLGQEAARILAAAPGLWLLAGVGLVAPGWDPDARRRAGFLGGLTLCSLAAIVPGLRFSDHYFVLLLPAASLLVAVGARALARLAAPWGAAPVRLLRVALPLVALVLWLVTERAYLFAPSPEAVARASYGANPFPEAVAIARYLDTHAAPDDRVAVIGSEPEIYFYARRRAATSHIYMYPLMEPHPFARRMQAEMIAELERARPRFMVLVNVDTSWSRRPDSDTAVLAWAARTVEEAYEPVGLVEILPGRASVHHWGAEAGRITPRAPSYVTTFRRRE